MKFILLLLGFGIAKGAFTEDYASPIVQTRLGGIEGSIKKSYNGRIYAAYEGIPYALPPMLERRFQPPEPITGWIGNLSATKPGSLCIQYSHTPKNIDDRVIGDEDCLYLSVYVPYTVTQKQLPVIFSIHGGGFQFGEADTGVKFLMDRDVIVVTISYRLGIFGFLSTEDDIVLGNMGLKDQSMALRWTSENIQYFGGDPKKITLIGISAGGASVHYHYLSPRSRGLFRNGISFSGATFGPGKQTENSREKAHELGALLGCPTENTSEMVTCLRSRPARSISQATKHFMPWLYNPFTPFGPVVEKTGDKPFVDRSPIEIINSGDAADLLWITGLVSEEGLYPAAEFINNDTLLQELNGKWDSIAPHLLDYNFTIPLDMHAAVARKIRNHYLGTKQIDWKTTQALTYLIGDRLYAVDVEKAARWQAKMSKSPVYFWYYSYRALTSSSDVLSNSMNNYGVAHSDDFSLLFEENYMYPPMRASDRAMQEKMIDFVVSVAEKGSPDFGLDFEWKRLDPSKNELEFLHIAGPDDIKMKTVSNFAEKRFWSTIDFNENKL